MVEYIAVLRETGEPVPEPVSSAAARVLDISAA